MIIHYNYPFVAMATLRYVSVYSFLMSYVLLMKVMTFDTNRYLSADNEMKRIFGARVVRSELK